MAHRFTIITSTFNCAAALELTATSIRAQTFPSIQWIIADGASSDGTVDVILKNADIASNWFSEKDRGIYDAWNKACKLIDGEWVMFLGAGDTLADARTVERLMAMLGPLDQNVVLAHGNVSIVDSATGELRYICRTPDLAGWEFARPRLPHHQGCLHRASLFAGDQCFDSSYRVAADSKFLLQAKQKGSFVFVDINVSKMDDNGVSNNQKNHFLVQTEINRVCAELNIKQPLSELFKTYAFRVTSRLAHLSLGPVLIKRVRAVIDKRRKRNSADTR